MEFEYQDAGLNWVKLSLTLTAVTDASADAEADEAAASQQPPQQQLRSPGGGLFAESDGKDIGAWAPPPVHSSANADCCCRTSCLCSSAPTSPGMFRGGQIVTGILMAACSS